MVLACSLALFSWAVHPALNLKHTPPIFQALVEPDIVNTLTIGPGEEYHSKPFHLDTGQGFEIHVWVDQWPVFWDRNQYGSVDVRVFQIHRYDGQGFSGGSSPDLHFWVISENEDVVKGNAVIAHTMKVIGTTDVSGEYSIILRNCTSSLPEAQCTYRVRIGKLQ